MSVFSVMWTELLMTSAISYPLGSCPDPDNRMAFVVNLIAFMESSDSKTSLTRGYLVVLRQTPLNFCIAMGYADCIIYKLWQEIIAW